MKIVLNHKSKDLVKWVDKFISCINPSANENIGFKKHSYANPC